MFDSVSGVGVDDPVDREREDAFAWASIERELRCGEEERTWGNTIPSGRLGRSVQLEQVLPETLALWQQGRLDERRVAAICDTTHYLSVGKARAVQRRVLERAPE
jgi:hypothetical protein